ncbi:MAG TPA: dihydroorotate dehydrogenase electron transfer subunit [Candidatus Polarisedimenticolia bacterium]|nr:dihydroorotate dehydrogenase electron transfer subunit [Candidatus Polarisedimenticolia bacterium]
MPVDISSRIVRHEALNPDHFLLTLEAPPIARAARAGQFVMLQVREGYDPLLRRPMSLYRVLPGRRGRIQILYKVVGEGTRHLSRQPVGTSLKTLGPLGNGFALSAPASRAGGAGRAPARPLLVAGGVGIAIFPFLVEALRARRRRPTLLFGARTRRDLVALDFFRRRRVPVHLATEDGSAGSRGFVTRLLEPLLRPAEAAAGTAGTAGTELYVCGPTPMMRAVREQALAAGVPCQLALESQMPCGIGVCLGCVVRCREDEDSPVFQRVCTEGPIFDALRVIL